jgi:hypothetical protein
LAAGRVRLLQHSPKVTKQFNGLLGGALGEAPPISVFASTSFLCLVAFLITHVRSISEMNKKLNSNLLSFYRLEREKRDLRFYRT